MGADLDRWTATDVDTTDRYIYIYLVCGIWMYIFAVFQNVGPRTPKSLQGPACNLWASSGLFLGS